MFLLTPSVIGEQPLRAHRVTTGSRMLGHEDGRVRALSAGHGASAIAARYGSRSLWMGAAADVSEFPAALRLSADDNLNRSRDLLIASAGSRGDLRTIPLLGLANLSHTTIYLHLSRRPLQAAPLEQVRVPAPVVLPRSPLKRKPSPA